MKILKTSLTMKRPLLFNSVLVMSLALGTPAAFAHAGHGDEFQAEGGVNRVEINEQTDAFLGIQIAPIEPTSAQGDAVMIPATALVEDNGRQLVFVQHDNFYEPVDVTTGETAGDLIAITEGLLVGEQLVTQGSLSLYAESRKTVTADSGASETVESETESVAATEEAHTKAHAEGIPHDHHHDHHHGISKKSLLAIAGGSLGVIGGAIAFALNSRKKSDSPEGTV